MSDIPSWEYKIIQRHLSSSCAPPSDLGREPRLTKGEYFMQKSAQVDTICIHSLAQGMKQFTIVLLHTNQSFFFINSDTSSFQWSFSLASGCSAPCQGRAMMVMTFSPLGIHGGGDCESQAEITWPAEAQTAAEESRLLHVHTGSKAHRFNDGETTAQHQEKRCRTLLWQFWPFKKIWK